MSLYIIHMIGHGHIDPTWLWNWKEGFEEIRATFRSALERMDETQEFIFTASSACFYQWIKESESCMFDVIKKRIQEGRWEIAGGFWVEPDCNIPCGESFVRHGLYSQRFFLREFGKRCSVGFNPDSFGHAGSLPQLLKKLGMEYYVYMRPEPNKEKIYPTGTIFWWQSQEGSSVLAAQIPDGYEASGKRITEKIKRLPYYSFLGPGQRHILCFYGVGNHGGGPTREAIKAIQEIDTKNGDDIVQPVFSSLENFFSEFLSNTDMEHIPVLQDELQHHARGCYSAHSEVKYLNRTVEHALMNAERLATVARWLGKCSYPHDEIEEAWKNLLYNQFHDILAGTCLESSYDNTRDQLGAARHQADKIINSAIQTIACDIDTSMEGNSIIVFNPLPWSVTAPLTAPPIVERNLKKPLHVVDESGQVIPSQPVCGERIDHVNYRFVGKIPALGYRVFHVRGGDVDKKHSLPLEGGLGFLSNSWWTLEFDPGSGEMTRFKDNHRNVDIIKRGHVLAAMVDHSDTWSHGLEEYRVEAGRFSNGEARIVEWGDVQCTLRIINRYDRSTAIAEYTLYRDIDRIDCKLRVNWQQQYQTLKLCFDTHIEAGTGTYDIPYGYQERSCDGGEEPGQHWFDLTGKIGDQPYGLSILNDGKYGFDIRNGTMRVTMLRSPAYAHHDNGRFDASQHWPIMDQGWHCSKFVLLPHAGNWRDVSVAKRAWELNAPPFIHPEANHQGTLGARRVFFEAESDTILISVVKASEDADDIIVRGYETAGRPASVHLRFPHFSKSFEVAFMPHEIKTVRINRDSWAVREVNLLEE